MAKGDCRVVIVSIEGTNCDEELRSCFLRLGADAEIVDLKQLTGEVDDQGMRRRLHDYDVLLFPGGFSAGDYVRAGAIMAARVRSSLGKELEDFARDPHRIVGGICNGFQVLVELGMLPGRRGAHLSRPQAALTTNASAHFECRPTYVSWQGGNFYPLTKVRKDSVYYFPSAHGEGNLVLSGKEEATLSELERNGQILFKWVDPHGGQAEYPWNPNGSKGDVAGITNRDGNVFGLMPHPERAFDIEQHPDDHCRGSAWAPFDGKDFLGAIVQSLG